MKELLGQPEYLHVLVNPLLTHALPLAALGLLLALVCRSRAGTRLALVLVLLAASSVWPALHYGQLGFDRVKAMADATGADWLDIHRYRAERSAWIFYATAAIAIAALAAQVRWPKSATVTAWVSFAAAAIACGVAGYVAYPAGRVRHREFRHGAPPAAELQAAHEDLER